MHHLGDDIIRKEGLVDGLVCFMENFDCSVPGQSGFQAALHGQQQGDQWFFFSQRLGQFTPKIVCFHHL